MRSIGFTLVSDGFQLWRSQVFDGDFRWSAAIHCELHLEEFPAEGHFSETGDPLNQVIQVVTFVSPIWRSVNIWKGHIFTIPKRSPEELPGISLFSEFQRLQFETFFVAFEIYSGISFREYLEAPKCETWPFNTWKLQKKIPSLESFHFLSCR